MQVCETCWAKFGGRLCAGSSKICVCDFKPRAGFRPLLSQVQIFAGDHFCSRVRNYHTPKKRLTLDTRPQLECFEGFKN